MRSETKALIQDYHQHVVRAHRMICERLRIQRIHRHCCAVANQPGRGFLDDANSISYEMRRSYCVVNFGNVNVRFSFVEDGSSYGFFSADLNDFAKSKGTFPEFADLDLLRAELEDLERNGELPLVPDRIYYAIPEEVIRVPTP